MSNDDQQSWDNASWEGSRKAQLRASLKLSARQRFEALEELAETSDWLARSRRTRHGSPESVPERPRASAPGIQERPAPYDENSEVPGDVDGDG